MLGLSLFLAMAGMVIGITGGVLLAMHRQRRLAVICLIAGLALIILPYAYIYFFLD